MNEFLAFAVGIAVGIAAGMGILAASLGDYTKIQKSENGYMLTHEGKIYILKEVKEVA